MEMVSRFESKTYPKQVGIDLRAKFILIITEMSIQVQQCFVSIVSPLRKTALVLSQRYQSLKHGNRFMTVMECEVPFTIIALSVEMYCDFTKYSNVKITKSTATTDRNV